MPADETTAAEAPQAPRAARRRRSPYLVPALVLAACLLLFPAFTVGYVAWSQDQNNHKFCQLIESVTAVQPPPGNASANPSRAYGQNLYKSAVALQGRLGC